MFSSISIDFILIIIPQKLFCTAAILWSLSRASHFKSSHLSRLFSLAHLIHPRLAKIKVDYVSTEGARPGTLLKQAKASEGVSSRQFRDWPHPTSWNRKRALRKSIECGRHLCKFIGTKESVCIRKKKSTPPGTLSYITITVGVVFYLDFPSRQREWGRQTT